jgi:urocanate hydratase
MNPDPAFHVLKRLCAKGSRFWDYGNSFMASVFDAGEHSIAGMKTTNDGFIWPSFGRHHGANVF